MGHPGSTSIKTVSLRFDRTAEAAVAT